jgi:diaminopimelate epimerase
VAFAHSKKIISDSTTFFAVDGLHAATYISPNEVKLEMKNVSKLSKTEDGLIIDTGSPHYILLVKDIEAIDVEKEGASIRYSNSFLPNGINVNFVEKVDSKHYKIRTYERGVEGETLACGTGAVAAALGMHYLKESEGIKEIFMSAKGGDLKISFKVTEHKYHQIFLKGPATHVFSGKVKL